MIQKALGAGVLRLAGWHIEGEPPPPDHVGVLLAAPHNCGSATSPSGNCSDRRWVR
jgi:hypothetical protein